MRALIALKGGRTAIATVRAGKRRSPGADGDGTRHRVGSGAGDGEQSQLMHGKYFMSRPMMGMHFLGSTL